MDKTKSEYQKEYRKRPTSISKHTLWWREYRKTDKYKLYKKGYNERIRPKVKEQNEEKKMATLTIMGGKCVRCGFSDSRALQIDHIASGGVQEKKKGGFKGGYYNHVLASFVKGENKYQLLCANCNWIKRFENGEHTAFNNK